MYVPAHNALDDRPAQLDFIQNEPFGILVSTVDGKFFATHAPFVVLRDEPVRLGVHIAKANPQWHGLEHGADVLAIFHGPHAMISASWYQDPRHSVPTWNYSAVHCRGRATLADSAGTRRIIERLVAGLEHGWTIETADEEYIKRLEHAIVGIEIAVAEISGKVKLGQNLSPENRERAAAFLSASSRAMDREVGQQMRTIRLPTKGDGK